MWQWGGGGGPGPEKEVRATGCHSPSLKYLEKSGLRKNEVLGCLAQEEEASKFIVHYFSVPCPHHPSQRRGRGWENGKRNQH